MPIQYRPLGRSGTRVSCFGMGGWTTFGGSVNDKTLIKDILTACFEAGINFFDIADVYAHGESETQMGRVLKDFPRHELVISSKVYFPMSESPNDRGLGRKHIMESIDDSLRRIGTDYLDIYFCHRFDGDTPLEETVRAMDDLVHNGKILYWGTSEWTADQLREAHKIADRRNLYAPQVEQPEYNLINRKFERGARAAVSELGMGAVTWSPLASGFLSGKYQEGVPADSRLARMDWLRERLLKGDYIARVGRFAEIATKIGCTPAQLALAWLLGQPAVSSVILGVSKVEQLRDNLNALDVKLNAELLGELGQVFA